MPRRNRPFMTALSLTALSLTLAACGEGEPVVARTGVDAAPSASTVLAGVDLNQPVRALGTEPFWSVEMTGSRMIYTGLDQPEAEADQPRANVQGTIAMFEAEDAEGRPFKVTLTATECSDGMSDRTYPLSALVEVVGRSLTGCAASAEAILNGPESGPVQPSAGEPPAPAQPAA